jgi:hypothetical protein
MGKNRGYNRNKVKNYVFPANPVTEIGAEWKGTNDIKKNLRNYITPVQLQRIRHDIQMWRDAISEAEQAWFPHRVKMQRMYIDTILSGHTLACVNRRKDLTLLREFVFTNENDEENDDLHKLFNKKWFAQFLNFALEAKFFGYSLIPLNDVVNDGFPKIGLIRRFNISPDRLNVTSYVYSIQGAQFLDKPYANWHVWVPTPTDVGISEVGYGELYSVAVYEIMARNLLGSNADAVELYGMPIRKGKTSKTDELERNQFEQALANMGSAGYILLDVMDELELVESKGMGQGYKIYSDFEKRLESKISKILLGHADAMDSVPGKLGATQGEDSPTHMALRDKQATDGAFLEDVVNDNLIPKMIKLGFNIDPQYKFRFSNNQEMIEKREKEDKNNLVTAQIAYQMKQAGLQYDPIDFEERTGIKTTLAPVASPITDKPKPEFSEKTKNRLKNLYGKDTKL